MNEILNQIGNYILISIVPPINLFVIFYALRSNWKATAPGRALMYSKISLMLLVDLSFVAVVFGTEYPGREWLRIGIFGFISFSQWRLFILLAKIQHDFPKEKKGLKKKESDEATMG